jgi:hypothetical protein
MLWIPSLSSQIGWTNRLCREAAASDHARVRETIEAVLTAPAFDAARLASLATRARYPVAARLLDRQCRRWGSILPILLERRSQHVRAFRLACAFGAISVPEIAAAGVMRAFTADNLRVIAACDDERGERAREALAAFGAIEWSKATPRARAAYVLQRLVRLHLGGAP